MKTVPELVSVIIPTYKRAHILPRAVRSVLNQTYSNLELIIVDDGSKDNTAEIVSSIKDERVRLISFSENKGAAAARNEGIKVAAGDFIAFLDSDDEWMPDKLRLSLNAFRENQGSNIGLVYTNGWAIKGDIKAPYFKDSRPSGIVYSKMQRERNIFPTSVSSPGPPFYVLHKKVFSDIGSFDENMRNWEDVDFFVRVALHYDIYFLNKPLAVIYQQKEHLGMVNADVMKSREYFFNKHKDRIYKDRNNFYRFTQKMGRDWLVLGNKQEARKYFLKALKIKPYKVELLGKVLEAL